MGWDLVRLAILLLGLTALGSGQSATVLNDVSIEALDAATAGRFEIEPGEWEMAIQFAATSMFDGPGLPKEAPAAKALLMQPHVETVCITPEQARHPSKLLLVDGPECIYGRFALDGERLEANAVCEAKFEGKVMVRQTVDFAGTVARDSFTLEASSTNEAEGAGAPVRDRVRTTGHRTGACNPPK